MRLPAPVDEAILEVVAAIPAGALLSYGDAAAIVVELGFPCGPRRVARTLSEFGQAVPWWRVVQSAGTLAGPVAQRAGVLLVADGVAVDGRRVALEEIRWKPEARTVRDLASRVDGGTRPDSVGS